MSRLTNTIDWKSHRGQVGVRGINMSCLLMFFIRRFSWLFIDLQTPNDGASGLYVKRVKRFKCVDVRISLFLSIVCIGSCSWDMVNNNESFGNLSQINFTSIRGDVWGRGAGFCPLVDIIIFQPHTFRFWKEKDSHESVRLVKSNVQRRWVVRCQLCTIRYFPMIDRIAHIRFGVRSYY